MSILGKVAVNAMHANFDVDRTHMHSFCEFLRIIRIDDRAIRIQQIALAVFLEDGAKIPTMTVVVCKLSVLKCGV